MLRQLAGVVDARVWTKGDALLARVVVTADSLLTGSDLQQACLDRLGEERTPRLVLLSRADQVLRTG